MIETRYKKIFDILTKDYDFHTASEIAGIISVSEKTVQNDISELNPLLKGAKIESKRGRGYIFKISDKDDFSYFLKNNWINYSFEEQDFNNQAYRIEYILMTLLFNKDYIKIEDMAEKLMISRSQLKLDLNRVREILKDYKLGLDAKPYYGLKLTGDEFDKRMCIKKEIIQVNPDLIPNLDDYYQEIQTIKKIVVSIFDKYDFNIIDIAFENLIYHLYVTCKRTRQKEFVLIGVRDILNLRENREYDIADEILKRIGEEFSLSFSEDEKAYIAMHLISKRNLDDDNKNEISKGVDEIVVKMLDKVKDTLHIDLTHDLDLRVNLGLHLIPLIKRINYHLTLKNPILDDIKNDFISYEAATVASSVVNEKYKINLSEDEIGYISLYFTIALRNNERDRKTKNILIVCNTGKATAQILKAQFLKEFKDYVKSVKTCDSNKINKENLDGYDLIITSIPIVINTDTPIIEIGGFINNRDVKNIKNFFNGYDVSKFFPKDLFLTDLDPANKGDLLKYLTDEINSKKKLGDNLLEEINKREKLAPTEFDNLIALPHPLNALADDTFITVGILKEPIIWYRRKVQLIFLMNIARDNKEDLKYLYQRIGDFLTDKEKILKLINNPDYTYFIKLFGLDNN
ncbi:BglG family transcription antiterminator [Anaerococcus sp. AGMB09787]|uniref:BglG family transcription antiterminator n=1 Tax=Anaerococcus sp. AGMB09787 TaxID=2922869 RepID=UPI001FAF7C36|nr:BglG family transcription antiterminator [Anaerococcus sp. AGMB09787]